MFSIVILGQKWLATSLLERLDALPHIEIRAVCSPSADRLALAARERGIENVALSECPAADIALVAHCHQFIPAAVRNRFRLGVLAYHPSLLPRHRGRDAVRWAIHMREPVTGGTLYWMDEGADTGLVEAQDWCHIRPDDTPETLWRRELAPMGLRLFVDAVNRLAAGAEPVRLRQDEKLATFEPAFTRQKLSQG